MNEGTRQLGGRYLPTMMVTVVALCIDVANTGPYESIFVTADSLVFGLSLPFPPHFRHMGINLYMCCAIAVVGGNAAVCTRGTM